PASYTLSLHDALPICLRLRELAGGQLRMNLLSINGDFERATARRNERKGPDVLLKPQQFFRQTDGMRLIVSSRAILDRDLDWHRDRKSTRLNSSHVSI